MFLEISQNSQENNCAREALFNKVAGLRPVKTLEKLLIRWGGNFDRIKRKWLMWKRDSILTNDSPDFIIK